MRKASQLAALLTLAQISLADNPVLEHITDIPEPKPPRPPHKPHQGAKERARRIKQKARES